MERNKKDNFKDNFKMAAAILDFVRRKIPKYNGFYGVILESLCATFCANMCICDPSINQSINHAAGD